VPEKCSFCYQTIDRGLALGKKPGMDREATPACVNACPTGARIFGDLNDPESNVSKALHENPSYRLARNLGTGPAVIICQLSIRKRRNHVKETHHSLDCMARLLGMILLGGLVAGILVFWKGLGITNLTDLVPWDYGSPLTFRRLHWARAPSACVQECISSV